MLNYINLNYFILLSLKQIHNINRSFVRRKILLSDIGSITVSLINGEFIIHVLRE